MARQLVCLLAALLLVVSACATPTQPPDPTPTTTLQPATTQPAPFTTMSPAVNRLFVVGDWGSGTEGQMAVAQAMRAVAEQDGVDAIVTTGDNFYSDDEAALMAPFQWALEAGVPFWVSWGNHDIESDHRIADMERVFSNPPRWEINAWGSYDVVILDSNQVGNADQLGFLDEYMSGSDRPAIVVFHHPAWSCSDHGPTTEILSTWVTRFDDDVVLVLSGHDHNYQRFEADGVAFVVTGGGGRHLYELEPCPTDHPGLIAGEASHHFVVVEALDDALRLEAVRADGATIDETVIEIKP